MEIVRLGLLHCPEHDEAASRAVVHLLRDFVSTVLVTIDESVQDQRHLIAEIIRRWCDEEEIDLLLTIGCTGIAPGDSGRQSVPQATEDAIERALPGLAEAMRAYAQDEYPQSLLEAGIVGIRGRTIVVNLPAGADEASLFLEGIADLLPPALSQLSVALNRTNPNEATPDSHNASSSLADSTLPASVRRKFSTNSRLSESEFQEYLKNR